MMDTLNARGLFIIRSFVTKRSFNMKKLLLIAVTFSTIFATQSANANEVSVLNYTKLEAGLAVASTKVKFLSKSYQFKSKALLLAGTYRLNDNFYAFADFQRSNTDDSDRKNGSSLAIDNQNRVFESGLGGIIPLSKTTDVTVELGARKSRNKTSTRLKHDEMKMESSQNLNDTSLLYAIGVRSKLSSHFELTAQYAIADDFQRFRFGGPMYVSDSTAIDVVYEYSRDKTKSNEYKANGLMLSLQTYF